MGTAPRKIRIQQVTSRDLLLSRIGAALGTKKTHVRRMPPST